VEDANPDTTTELERQYEVLRQQVLNPKQPSNGVGLAVLIRNGMAAWMGTLTSQLRTCCVDSGQARAPGTVEHNPEWVFALAALVLGNRLPPWEADKLAREVCHG